MGASDLLKPVIERQLNGAIHFGRVKVKPGKPTTFATVPMPNGKVPVFALPGNPASALVMFHIFVVPALRRLAGWTVAQCHMPRVKVKVGRPLSRRWYILFDDVGFGLDIAATYNATGPKGRVPSRDDPR